VWSRRSDHRTLIEKSRRSADARRAYNAPKPAHTHESLAAPRVEIASSRSQCFFEAIAIRESIIAHRLEADCRARSAAWGTRPGPASLPVFVIIG